MTRNSKYTKEFKDSTIQLVMKSEQSVLKIGADLGVNPKTIYNWVREYKKANNIPTLTKADIHKNITKETVEEENRRLRAENKLLRQERDILKKATAYFAKETL
jgi:transposase